MAKPEGTFHVVARDRMRPLLEALAALDGSEASAVLCTLNVAIALDLKLTREEFLAGMGLSYDTIKEGGGLDGLLVPEGRQ